MDEVDEQAYSMHELSEGSPQAFKKLFFQHYSDLFSFAYSLLGNKVSARSSAIDAFFLLWKKRRHVNNEKDARAFLYGTTRNNCFNYLRYKQKNPDAREYFPEVEMDPAFPNDILEEVWAYAARFT